MRTDRGLDRFVTFLDAGAAIALLVLAEILQNVAFLLSFAVIARFWLVHHRVVEGVGSGGRQLPARAAGSAALRRHQHGELGRPDGDHLPGPAAAGAAQERRTLSRRVDYGAMLLLLLTGPVESWLRRRERDR